MTIIRVGTRKSELAMRQTRLVAQAIKQVHPEVEIELVPMSTRGDRILDKPLLEFGGKGVFVTEIEEMLQKKEIDIAVHSAKDLPQKLADGLEIIATPRRESPRDVLVTTKGRNIEKEEGAVIGTGSLRRAMQIKRIYPNAEVKGLRGNVNTRLQKLEQGEYDGIVLAEAGLRRMGLMDAAAYQYVIFSTEEIVPAGGQGILAVEGRRDDEIARLVRDIRDVGTYRCFEAEREVLRLLNAGCNEPYGVYAELEKDEMHIRLALMRNERIHTLTVSGDASQGKELAEKLVQG